MLKIMTLIILMGTVFNSCSTKKYINYYGRKIASVSPEILQEEAEALISSLKEKGLRVPAGTTWSISFVEDLNNNEPINIVAEGSTNKKNIVVKIFTSENNVRLADLHQAIERISLLSNLKEEGLGTLTKYNNSWKAVFEQKKPAFKHLVSIEKKFHDILLGGGFNSEIFKGTALEGYLQSESYQNFLQKQAKNLVDDNTILTSKVYHGYPTQITSMRTLYPQVKQADRYYRTLEQDSGDWRDGLVKGFKFDEKKYAKSGTDLFSPDDNSFDTQIRKLFVNSKKNGKDFKKLLDKLSKEGTFLDYNFNGLQGVVEAMFRYPEMEETITDLLRERGLVNKPYLKSIVMTLVPDSDFVSIEHLDKAPAWLLDLADRGESKSIFHLWSDFSKATNVDLKEEILREIYGKIVALEEDGLLNGYTYSNLIEVIEQSGRNLGNENELYQSALKKFEFNVKSFNGLDMGLVPALEKTDNLDVIEVVKRSSLPQSFKDLMDFKIKGSGVRGCRSLLRQLI